MQVQMGVPMLKYIIMNLKSYCNFSGLNIDVYYALSRKELYFIHHELLLFKIKPYRLTMQYKT